MKYGFMVAAALCVLAAGCGKVEEPKDVIARVGDRAISQKELDRSYSLNPEWKRGETQLHSYLTQINALTVEKLYAQEAEKLGLDRDSLLQKHLTFLKQKEMIKGLYRKEIKEKVHIDEAEERQIYEWTKKKVDYDFVYCADSAQCARFASELNAKNINQLQLPADSSVQIGSQKNVKVGANLPQVEKALFTSKVNQVTGPISVGSGYLAIKVRDWTREMFMSNNDFLLDRKRIDKLIAEYKSDSSASFYIYNMMKDKDLKLNGPVFWAVANYFFRRVEEAHIDRMNMKTVYVTSDEIQNLTGDLRAMGKESVATYRDGTLTVNELLDALAAMPGSLRPRVRTPQNLKAAIGGIVRNRYLLREAERQGLDKDPEVLFEYNLQRDETLANAYYGRCRGDVQVTPDEVEAYKKHAPVAENQVFFKFNMTTLARDAKTDSVLSARLPALKAAYTIAVDTAKIRTMCQTPDSVLKEDPTRLFVREIFQ